MQGGPLEHTIAAKAVAFKEAESESFIQYQTQVIDNAKALAETLDKGGLRLVSGGTDNHMTLVDVTPMGLSGKEAEESLGRAGRRAESGSVPLL